MARLATRLTERLGIAHPILSAPMALAGGGALAAAVTRAGGLGLIGGGSGDEAWIAQQFAALPKPEQLHLDLFGGNPAHAGRSAFCA